MLAISASAGFACSEGVCASGSSRGAIEKTPQESADREAIARLASSARGMLRLRPAARSP
jgi:hypothetical protein